MQGIAYYHIIILVFQCFLVGSLILILFRARTIFGMGMLYMALGLFKFMHYFYNQAFSVEIIQGINIYIGSTVMFPGILFTILLLYIREDAAEARKVVYAVMFFNFFFVIMLYTTGISLTFEGLRNNYYLPKSFFEFEIVNLIMGTLAIFIDSVVLIALYEKISKKINFLFLRIFLTMSIVLFMHSTIWNLLPSFGDSLLPTKMMTGLISKIICIPSYSLVFWLYLALFEKKIDFIEERKSFNDIFSLMTYRQRFEQVSQEKEDKEKELHKSEDRIRAIYEMAPNMIMVISKENDLQSINPAFTLITGWETREWINKNFCKIIHPDERGILENELKNVFLGADIKFREFRILCKNGDYKYIALSTSLLIVENSVIGVLIIASDISDLKMKEEKLKESEAYANALFEYAAVPIWVEDFTEVKKYFDSLKNQGIRDFKKYFKENVDVVKHIATLIKILKINHKNLELYETESKDELILNLSNWFNEDSWSVFSDEITALAEGQCTFESEITLVTPKNETKHLILTLSVHPDYLDTLKIVFVSFIDITEHFLMEKKARKMSLAVHQSNSVILITDTDGLIEYVNPKYTEITGYNYVEAIGQKAHIFQPEFTSNEILFEIMETINAGKMWVGEFFSKKKLGGNYIASASISPLRDIRGDIINFVIIKEDITEKKKYEEEINEYRGNLEVLVSKRTEELKIKSEELERNQKALLDIVDELFEQRKELEKAKKKAESADRLKSAFLGTMSHELRTPLNSIIGFTGILIKEYAGPLNDEQKKQLGMAKSSALHLLDLVNDVLDISKIEAGQLAVSSQKFNFKDVIIKCISSVRPIANDKNLEIIVNISHSTEEIVSDKKRVEQIIINLLSNAIKFTERGRVSVKTEEINGNILTSVEDTGIGINKNDIEKLFKPFSQLDTGLSRNSEGTGLGLSISNRLAEKLGGKILVESKPNEGSIFTVFIPIGN